MSYQVRFYVGETNSEDERIIGTEGPTLAVNLLTRRYGGVTTTRANGAWEAPDGRIIQETSYVLEVIVDDSLLAEVVELAGTIKSIYQQSAVLYTTQALNSAVFV
jgi:hypothetical protein